MEIIASTWLDCETLMIVLVIFDLMEGIINHWTFVAAAFFFILTPGIDTVYILDDRDLVCVTIGEIDSSLKVQHAADGVEALSYLSKAKADNALPCLVILDINMPKMDGKATLAETKKTQHLARYL